MRVPSVLALCAALAAASGCGSAPHPATTVPVRTAAAPPKPRPRPRPSLLAAQRADVAAYNRSSDPRTVAAVARLGELSCAVVAGGSFPGETLITVVSAGGEWFQFGFRAGRELPSEFQSGPDFRSDLPDGETWAQIVAAADVRCSIDASGRITIRPRR